MPRLILEDPEDPERGRRSGPLGARFTPAPNTLPAPQDRHAR
ncbi:hypothetical protein DB30_01635 [Enhygromyxa salina]|uniref:Uncharacterized protein n=1 Tax=Enhygromyxa salina TaxID=215803 RepID=A0A0C1Z3S9_9BACT|nr:hypothetical protein DB30_01635 [Enhygromyxa salina]